MELVPQSIRWLVPDETVPCDIYLHFRGQYVLAVPGAQAIPLATLEKCAKAKYLFFFIKPGDQAAFRAWSQTRRPIGSQANAKRKGADDDHEQLYGNKRAELISFVQRSVQPRGTEVGGLAKAYEAALQGFAAVAKSPMLDWYFRQFHEPPELFHHNGRVAFLAATFAKHHGLLGAREIDDLLFFALIHQLEGDPRETYRVVVSQQTISALEKSRRPVPEAVIELLKAQDELCSGKGFPSQKAKHDLPLATRIFTLFNHFDHLRLKSSGTRRARFDQARAQMEARKEDYDDALWEDFWVFLEKETEVVS